MMAKAVHGEARGENYTGKVAVAAVILNRIPLSFPILLRKLFISREHSAV